MVHEWGSEDILQQAFFFYHVGAQDCAWTISPEGKRLHWPSVEFILAFILLFFENLIHKCYIYITFTTYSSYDSSSIFPIPIKFIISSLLPLQANAHTQINKSLKGHCHLCEAHVILK